MRENPNTRIRHRQRTQVSLHVAKCACCGLSECLLFLHPLLHPNTHCEGCSLMESLSFSFNRIWSLKTSPAIMFKALRCLIMPYNPDYRARYLNHDRFTRSLIEEVNYLTALLWLESTSWLFSSTINETEQSANAIPELLGAAANIMVLRYYLYLSSLKLSCVFLPWIGHISCGFLGLIACVRVHHRLGEDSSFSYIVVV